MINTVPPISLCDAGDSRPVIKRRILICEVDAHLVVISFIVLLELECSFLCGERPAESIQSARRKLQGQELITEKAVVRDFGKSFFQRGRSLHHLLQNVQLLMMAVSETVWNMSGSLFRVAHGCWCIFRF